MNGSNATNTTLLNSTNTTNTTNSTTTRTGTTVTLSDGQYVIDWNYPGALFLELSLAMALLYKLYLTALYYRKMKKVLLAGSLALDLVALGLVAVGLVACNQFFNANIKTIHHDLIETELFLHIVAKFLVMLLLCIRSWQVWTDKRVRVAAVAVNAAFAVALLVLFGFAIDSHIQYLRNIENRDTTLNPNRRENIAFFRGRLITFVMAHVWLFSPLLSATTVLWTYFGNQKFIRENGWRTFTLRSRTYWFSFALCVDQIIQLALISSLLSGAINFGKTYVHGLNVQFVLFSLFFFHNTVEMTPGEISNDKGLLTRLFFQSSKSMDSKPSPDRSQMRSVEVRSDAKQ